MRLQSHCHNVLPVDSTLRVRTRSQPAVPALFLLVILATALVACSYSSEAAAHSGSAEMGAPHRIGLWDCEDTRDGPTVADFDQSLWLPVRRDPAELMSLAEIADGPGDAGTITLVGPDRAQYQSDRGSVFTFERHGETLTFAGCVPWAYTLEDE